MKKDIFNGNIKKEYINYVRFTLAFATILFFSLFSFYYLLYYIKKQNTLQK